MKKEADPMSIQVSVVVPVYNEELAIGEVIDSIGKTLAKAGVEHEIIVVDDGSTDSTSSILKKYAGKIELISHPDNIGYGRSIKDGIMKARYPYVCMIDGDASYPVNRMPDLLSYLGTYDMVVGARTGENYKGSLIKYPARILFLWLSEFASGRRIPDVNSGFRVFRKDAVKRHFNTLCAGFSFTTTITLAMSLGGYFIKYVPIEYHRRKGQSKIRYIRDTMRSLQIIVETILYYNPIKIFILLAGILWFIALLGLMAYKIAGVEWAMALAISAFLTSFIVFGLGLTTDLLRKVNMKEEGR